MTRRRVGVAAAVLFLALAVLQVLLGGAPRYLPTEPHPRSAEPAGLRALWRGLERLGLPVGLWARPPGNLSGRGSVLLLPVTDDRSSMLRVGTTRRREGKSRPEPMPPLPKETVDRFGHWVAAGNTLVVPLDGERETTRAFCAEAFGWPRDAVGTDAPGPTAAQGLLASPEEFATRVRADLPGAEPVLGSASAPFAVSVPHGSGAVILIASIEPFSNRALRAHPRNAVGIVRFLERELHARPHDGTPLDGRLWIDVSGFGELDYDSPFTLAVSSRALPATLHAVLALLLLILATAFRFGPVRDPEPARVRGQLEAARGIASLYARSKKPALAARALSRGLADRLRAGLGLPPETPARVLARRSAERAGGDAARIESLLEPPAVLGERELLLRAREGARLEAEILRAPNRS